MTVFAFEFWKTEGEFTMQNDRTNQDLENLKRNLAEQSKWLNDDTGDRSWAVHPTQDIRWWMNVQNEALARGK